MSYSSAALFNLVIYVHSVSGTNFSIERTAITVGGFTQPAVARAIIDTPGHAEKGLQQRYLWLFPKPVFAPFETLEPVDAIFYDSLGKKVISNSVDTVLYEMC